MMEEDLEERLLGGRDVNSVSAVAGDDTRGLHRYNTDQRTGFGSPAGLPQLRDLRKRKPSPDKRRTTSSGSGDEAVVISPRDEASPSSPNPFDDEASSSSTAQEAPHHLHSNGTQDVPAPRRVTSPVARTANGGDAADSRANEKKQEEDTAQVADEDSNSEGKQERAEARKHDEEALARVHLRMERLWKLEGDHASLTHRYARLEEAKKKTEAERAEWQQKHAQQVEENEKMAATLKEWEGKCAVLQREKQESEVATQKLNKKLDDERERYALLSSQFNELNAKMVEIINNVTNLKLDEIEQEKEARRLGAPPKKKAPSGPAPPITQSAAAYFGFASPSKPATPTKAKAAALTPSKPRE